MENREIEAKFLEIDKPALVAKLKTLGADDLGEDFLRETIFYDHDLLWQTEKKKIIRLRQTKSGIFLTYKHDETGESADVTEIEVNVSDMDKAKQILEMAGMVAYREQEKRRHKFLLGDVIVDIDEWPQVPAYVEIEGPSEEVIKETAAKLGFDWKDAVFGVSGNVIEKHYDIHVAQLKKFTFEQIE